MIISTLLFWDNWNIPLQPCGDLQGHHVGNMYNRYYCCSGKLAKKYLIGLSNALVLDDEWIDSYYCCYLEIISH